MWLSYSKKLSPEGEDWLCLDVLKSTTDLIQKSLLAKHKWCVSQRQIPGLSPGVTGWKVMASDTGKVKTADLIVK